MNLFIFYHPYSIWVFVLYYTILLYYFYAIFIGQLFYRSQFLLFQFILYSSFLFVFFSFAFRSLLSSPFGFLHVSDFRNSAPILILKILELIPIVHSTSSSSFLTIFSISFKVFFLTPPYKPFHHPSKHWLNWIEFKKIYFYILLKSCFKQNFRFLNKWYTLDQCFLAISVLSPLWPMWLSPLLKKNIRK